MNICANYYSKKLNKIYNDHISYLIIYNKQSIIHNSILYSLKVIQ